MTPIVAFAPAPVRLFGDGLDELGLSVIALAVDHGTSVTLKPDPRSDTFDLEPGDVEPRGGEPSNANDGRDDLRAAVAELIGAGARFPSGGRIVARDELGSRAGGGARTTRLVAILRALIEFAGEGGGRLADPRRLAELAWRAALRARGTSLQRADALTSAVGGALHLSFGPTPFVQELAHPGDGLVLVEVEHDDPRDRQEQSRQAVAAAFADLREVDPGLDVAAISYEAVWNLLLEARTRAADARSAEQRERLVFTMLRARDLVHAALRAVGEIPFEPARLGELLDLDHARLREELDSSAPRIDALRAAALAAGALGAKLCATSGELVAYAPGREQEVAAAVERLGARARCVARSGGARITSSGRA